MSLRLKLLVALLPLAVALGVVGVLAVPTTNSLGRSAQSILTDNYRSVLAAQRMTDAIGRLDDAASLRLLGAHDLASDHARAMAGWLKGIVPLVAVVALAVGVIVSASITTRLLQPLHMLTRTVRQIGEGEFETRANIPGSDELAQLARNVKRMAGCTSTGTAHSASCSSRSRPLRPPSTACPTPSWCSTSPAG